LTCGQAPFALICAYLRLELSGPSAMSAVSGGFTFDGNHCLGRGGLATRRDRLDPAAPRRYPLTMNTSTYAVAIAAGALAGSLVGASAQDASAQSVIAPGAKLERLSSGFSFTEGPTCDASGNIFFTDQPNDRIMEWSVAGVLTTFMQPAGRANGMYMDAKGNLIACADEKNALWSITPDKKVTVLIKDYQGKYLNGPNDVWVAPNGQMWITDPFYKRTWWDHQTMALESEQVFYLSADGKTLTQVTSDLKKPNGITGTPDGKTLFVADIGADRTYRYAIQADGSLADKTLFCAKGSDGMTIDEQGNIYLCGRGVTVFDKTGKQTEHIDVAEPWTANVSFGGRDHKTLFITASKRLYSIRLNFKGANPGK
jgi:gluconolactonase